MVRLNANLRKTLAVIAPHDGRPRMVDWLATEADARGLTGEQLGRYVGELGRMGLLTVEPDGDGDFTVFLTSDAASYFKDRWEERLRACGRCLFQLLVGTSGGLLALLLQQWLAQNP